MVSPLKWSALFIVVNKSAHLGEQTCSPKWAVHEGLYGTGQTKGRKRRKAGAFSKIGCYFPS